MGNRFHLPRSTADIGVFHPRYEINKGQAFDIPFEVTVSADLLAMLIPTASDDKSDPETFIAELFSDEGYIRRPALNPLSINRKPEGAVVTIWDQEDFGDPLTLKPCRLNKLKIELKSPFQLVLSGQIQYSQYSDAELLRINQTMRKSIDIEIDIEADLFDADSGGESEKAEETVAEEETAYGDPDHAA